ncbi:DUF4738 domain-containing protein [Bacteroides sp. 214]|uniref:DUF4738 domain-containing protein n=1 Tax=Bacteroides sp. 214 TaxID=2302935 RepID=UPI0013D49D0B|nr:DUF4738 domain-containing protein [Bacteroides sp. 214]NDW11419.1 DUF4738 domain-containing protein [Bacteroides sp. 214]
MNSIARILLLLALLLIFCGCSNKSKSEQKDAYVLMESTVDAHGLQKMQEYRNELEVTFKGKNYKVFLARTPDSSLPQVKSETGDMFLDNKIELKITQGGSNIFSKTFRKQDFSSVVAASFMKNAILEGMVYNKVSAQGIVLAASVSYPQTDLYIPISITITAEGKMTMVRDELLDEIYSEE